MMGMKKLLPFLSVAALVLCSIMPAYSQEAAPAVMPPPSGLSVNVDILSDTNGADLGPYMRTLISDLKKHWLAPAGAATNQPLLKQEDTIIDMTIAPDGHLLAMRVEDSTHDSALDKTAWSAAKETNYVALPAGMNDQNLKLRAHFVVNR
jgi:TonB family protein